MNTAIEWIKDFGGNVVGLGFWLLKQIFGKEKLSQKIIVDLCSGNRAVTVNCGDGSNIRVWMNIRNYTPFDQKLDNLTVTYHQAGISVKLRPDKKHIIKAFSEEKIYLNDNITSEQAIKIALENDGSNDPRLEYHADFSNRLYELPKFGSLECLAVEKLNDHLYKQHKKAG